MPKYKCLIDFVLAAACGYLGADCLNSAPISAAILFFLAGWDFALGLQTLIDEVK